MSGNPQHESAGYVSCAVQRAAVATAWGLLVLAAVCQFSACVLQRLLRITSRATCRTDSAVLCSCSRRAELEALKASEASRQQAAAALTTSCATACLSLTQSHAQQLTAEAVELSRLLLLLLDGCVLPADLVPAAEGDDSRGGLQRLSLEELSRLAAAQDAVSPAGQATGAAVCPPFDLFPSSCSVTATH